MHFSDETKFLKYVNDVFSHPRVTLIFKPLFSQGAAAATYVKFPRKFAATT